MVQLWNSNTIKHDIERFLVLFDMLLELLRERRSSVIKNHDIRGE